MLADTVEAAVRSMHDPTPQKIREFISKLVRGKLDDGQLDNAPLTLRDITRICEAFATVLNGVFHERIEYPAISPAAAAHVAAQARLTEAAESPVEERELHRIQPEEGNASGGEASEAKAGGSEDTEAGSGEDADETDGASGEASPSDESAGDEANAGVGSASDGSREETK